MRQPRCPSCLKVVPPREQNESFPFCTERCRLIDLGRWLNEEYRIVVSTADEDEDGSTPPVGAGG